MDSQEVAKPNATLLPVQTNHYLDSNPPLAV